MESEALYHGIFNDIDDAKSAMRVRASKKVGDSVTTNRARWR